MFNGPLIETDAPVLLALIIRSVFIPFIVMPSWTTALKSVLRVRPRDRAISLSLTKFSPPARRPLMEYVNGLNCRALARAVKSRLNEPADCEAVTSGNHLNSLLLIKVPVVKSIVPLT